MDSITVITTFATQNLLPMIFLAMVVDFVIISISKVFRSNVD